MVIIIIIIIIIISSKFIRSYAFLLWIRLYQQKIELYSIIWISCSSYFEVEEEKKNKLKLNISYFLGSA